MNVDKPSKDSPQPPAALRRSTPPLVSPSASVMYAEPRQKKIKETVKRIKKRARLVFKEAIVKIVQKT